MKMICRAAIPFALILFSTPLVYGQDLSRYRNFSFGMNLAEVTKQVDSQRLQTKLIHKRPAVIHEATWWPGEPSGSPLQGEPVWQVLFTFYNGQLYRILVTYEHRATEGLSAEDIVEAISAQYGTPTRPGDEITFPTNELYTSTEKVIARWEDSEYSFNLFRSSFLNSYGLVMFSKRLDAQVRAAVAEAIKLEAQKPDPQEDIDRRKKEADNLDVARQKNRKTFRP
jgi:hypothetical protein